MYQLTFKHAEAKVSQLGRGVQEVAKISEMQTGELHDLVSLKCVRKRKNRQEDKYIVDYVKN